MSNTMLNGRTIYKRGDEAGVLELLRSVFVAELLSPSTTIWLVSPWFSEVPILDNRLEGFRHLEPQWPRAEIRLGTILATLAERGTKLVMVARPMRRVAPDEASSVTERFLSDLERRVSDAAYLTIHRNFDRVHTKGLLGDRYLLSGSMNFTYSGVKINDELVRFTTSEAEAAEARMEFRGLWGNS